MAISAPCSTVSTDSGLVISTVLEYREGWLKLSGEIRPGYDLEAITTEHFKDRSASTRCEPIKPVPPNTTTLEPCRRVVLF
tara:strand:- start:414 stop:656 length:243 start_codon:yes stop_codon:yes gene_type:complete